MTSEKVQETFPQIRFNSSSSKFELPNLQLTHWSNAMGAHGQVINEEDFMVESLPIFRQTMYMYSHTYTHSPCDK